MPQNENENLILVSFHEMLTGIIKERGIHEGKWMLYVEFGLTAVNIPIFEDNDPNPPTEEYQLNNIRPTVMVPIKTIGIQPADRLSNIAVDAAVVNPKPKRSTTARKTPKKK